MATARASVSAAVAPRRARSATSSLSGTAPVATANTTSPSSGVCAGWIDLQTEFAYACDAPVEKRGTVVPRLPGRRIQR